MRKILLTGIAAIGLTVSAFAADDMFVMKAAKGGMAEVELGRLAAEKGTTDEVKNFGRRMSDDHGRAGMELKALAERKHIALPGAIDAKDQLLLSRLNRLSGLAFDRAYMRAMLDDHVKDVSEFRTESQSGADPDVKAWAAKTLPTLEEHLKMARDANSSVATTTR